ncbi:MAG TPA: ABC transporter ATP-binding protein [Trueperaceae bacterium]
MRTATRHLEAPDPGTGILAVLAHSSRGKAVRRIEIQPIIDVRSVTKRHGATLALDDVSLSVEQGQVFALLGPNGAGKTTLVHILATIQRADSGTVTVAGFDVRRFPLSVRKNLGVVFQESTLDDRLTVGENLEFHGLIYGVPTSLRRKRISDLIEVVDLGDWRDKMVRTLSGGMKRRLEIARALVHDARVIFLDEPTVGLDAQSRERIWSYVAQLHNQRELTILVTTHYIAEVEAADCVCIIDGGKVIATESPDELRRQHGREFLRVMVDENVRTAVVTRYPGSIEAEDGELVVPVTDSSSLADLISTFGSSVVSVAAERSSLETVFLSLTGRDLRDREATPQERTRAFGSRGGEHTR